MKTDKDIETLITETREIISRTDRSFSKLTTGQLNWKPSAERWSVAQCFEHLITTNKGYLTTFEALDRGEKKTRLAERLPFLSTIGGSLLKRSLDPKSTRKLKAPSKARPTSSNLDSSILSDFIDQQNVIIGYMNRLKKLDTERIILTSPFFSLITYNLADAFRILVVHEQRHLLQADNVVLESEFPGESTNAAS